MLIVHKSSKRWNNNNLMIKGGHDYWQHSIISDLLNLNLLRLEV